MTTRVTPNSRQPVGHDQQPAGHRLVAPDLLRPPAVLAWAGHPHTAGQLGLADIQRRDPLDDLLGLLRLLQHPGLPCAPTTNGRSPAGAAGLKANLIRVLKATMKGPGAAPSTRLINGLQRPRTSGVSGQPPRFSPRNGRHPQGGIAAYQLNAGNRCTDRPIPWSRPTVRAKGMRSIRHWYAFDRRVDMRWPASVTRRWYPSGGSGPAARLAASQPAVLTDASDSGQSPSPEGGAHAAAGRHRHRGRPAAPARLGAARQPDRQDL